MDGQSADENTATNAERNVRPLGWFKHPDMLTRLTGWLAVSTAAPSAVVAWTSNVWVAAVNEPAK